MRQKFRQNAALSELRRALPIFGVLLGSRRPGKYATINLCLEPEAN